MRGIFARAPSRVDFGGGTLDLPFFAEREKGATLNCAVNKYGYASIIPNGRNLTISSEDYNLILKLKCGEIKYDGKLDLIKAAVKRTGFCGKVTLTSDHEMKPHSRLGTSSSISVAVIGAILRYQKKKIDKIAVAELATSLERQELGMDNGPQDQYAAALGGINMLRYDGKKTSVERVKVKPEVLFELEKNLILCYLDSSKVAGNINHETVDGYERGDERVVGAIRSIKKITFDMYKALRAGNLRKFAELLNEENESREKLNKDIVNAKCRKYISLGLRSGAVAAKILGAGAGGTILFYSREGERDRIRRVLEKNGGRVLDFRFDFEGLRTWEKEV
jgi:D-glycero-alpha-D-manno-heptose-7-phosphate kinase